MNGDAVVPIGKTAVVSAIGWSVNAYRAFCFSRFPYEAMDINRVKGFASGASGVGLWKNGSLS